MTDPLYALLVLSLIVSCACLLISTAMVGRKLADLDYQRAAGIDGTSRLQGFINLRTHSMRVLVGVTFGVFAVLLLADAPMIWRQWVNRILFVVVPSGYVVASVLDWLAEREQQRIEIANELAERAAVRVQAADAERVRHATLEADRVSLMQITDEALVIAEMVARQARADHGDPEVTRLAAVVGEHGSPMTLAQARAAEIATLRARVTAAGLGLGLEPRTADPPADTRPILAVPPGTVGQSLEVMAAAADETLHAAEKTVTAAEGAVEMIGQERERGG